DAVERRAGLRVMDAACISRNISPGGAADMLSLGMFLSELPFSF
ncbi:MAG: triphosphoribosyl-dephospho-CoA synthase, partial [Firmicutes bacterium]|nr:triphosphoribosyl-dephospho-CoA synthase [Bacillota bacterium]